MSLFNITRISLIGLAFAAGPIFSQPVALHKGAAAPDDGVFYPRPLALLVTQRLEQHAIIVRELKARSVEASAATSRAVAAEGKFQKESALRKDAERLAATEHAAGKARGTLGFLKGAAAAGILQKLIGLLF